MTRGPDSEIENIKSNETLKWEEGWIHGTSHCPMTHARTIYKCCPEDILPRNNARRLPKHNDQNV